MKSKLIKTQPVPADIARVLSDAADSMDAAKLAMRNVGLAFAKVPVRKP